LIVHHAVVLAAQSGNTPLVLAARNGDAKVVAVLVAKARVNVNAKAYGGLTVIVRVICSG
jgi:hypothetical protein